MWWHHLSSMSILRIVLRVYSGQLRAPVLMWKARWSHPDERQPQTYTLQFKMIKNENVRPCTDITSFPISHPKIHYFFKKLKSVKRTLLYFWSIAFSLISSFSKFKLIDKVINIIKLWWSRGLIDILLTKWSRGLLGAVDKCLNRIWR